MNPIIYVVGSSNMDLITLTERMPKAGETLIGRKFYTRCGGKGANQAVAVTKIARDKNAIRFVSTIANDSNGMDLLSNFKKVGMNTEFVMVCDNVATGVATICIDEKGENSIIVVPGANACFFPSVFDRVKVQDSCKVIVLQLEIPIETIKHILRFCRENGIVSVLNPAPASKEFVLSDPVFDCVDYLIPNETESVLLSDGNSSDSKEILMDRLLADRRMTVIMTLGGEGAFVGRGHQRKHIPCPQVIVKDTVGAGDCFVGTFAYLLAECLDKNSFAHKEEVDFETICDFAQKSCFASSYSVQFEGGFDKYPSSIINHWD